MRSKKLNIMKTRPEISDEEIHSMMDFDKILQQHSSVRRLKTASTIVGSCVLIAIIAAWWFFKPVEKTEPVIIPAVKQPIVAPEQKPAIEEKVAKPVEIQKPKQTTQQPEKPKEVVDVYSEAEPIEGYDNLNAYFAKELKYPAGAQGSGDVSVTFVINRQGKPQQLSFLNSLGPEFDKEVTRVIDNMPAWKPATQNGKPVPAKISQTFSFSMP